MNVDECLKKGLLKRERKDLQKASKSIEAAEHKLALAEKTLKARIYEDTILNAYASMFHSARALLYKDGYTEKSHYALYVYLKEEYRNKIEPKYINELNNLRLERHEVLYGLEKTTITKEESQEVTEIAREFTEKTRQLLAQEKNQATRHTTTKKASHTAPQQTH